MTTSDTFESGGLITFLDGQPERQPDKAEFVGGPWADSHAVPIPDQPTVHLADGAYVRSVRCADDDAIRFVWHPAPGDGGTASEGPG